MKPICYKNNKSGGYFKFVPLESITPKDWDDVLDIFAHESNTFVTEEEFNAQYNDVMEIDVRGNTSLELIGTLYTKELFLNENEDDT